MTIYDTLHLFNTTTKQLERFVPMHGNHVRWYVCGPTVYDSAHLGHARTYVSFDILRRVMSDYFNYEVTFVMNVTDIDDKIINRAKEIVGRGVGERLRSVNLNNHELKNGKTGGELDATKLIKSGKIDNNLDLTTENSDFSLPTNVDLRDACNELTNKFTSDFFKDLQSLNILKPTIVTRVTDYIEKIKDFIADLETKEFAYAVNGSVYFDISKYREVFQYPVFVDSCAVDDSESDSEKRNRVDFALWKKSTDISYPSRWGPGRPGWHIECSAMAGDVLGTLDIHAGGIDLAFPHHENEVVQSQAQLGAKWCNYFIHTGHLHIHGCKMSKSLKNFVTIKEVVERYGGRCLRMLFLLHNWNEGMELTDEAVAYAGIIEKKIFNFVSINDLGDGVAFFMGHAKADDLKEDINETGGFNKNDNEGGNKRNDSNEKAKIGECGNEYIGADLKKGDDKRNDCDGDALSLNVFNEYQQQIHSALCANVDTRRVIDLICEWIAETNRNRYGRAHRNMIANYVRKIMRIFGFLEEVVENDSGLGEVLCDLRAGVRKAAKNKSAVGTYFELCDTARIKAGELGFVIEDVGMESTIRKRI